MVIGLSGQYNLGSNRVSNFRLIWNYELDYTPELYDMGSYYHAINCVNNKMWESQCWNIY